MATNEPPPESTLHLPRLLCLHGGGVTGPIFQTQSRAFIKQLLPYFRLVFADGPFICDAGPGIASVYSDCGPFRRWLRWLPEHGEIDSENAVDEIKYQLETAMAEDDQRGATGEWVGLMGFSQGAKLTASLLFEQQIRWKKHGREQGMKVHLNNLNGKGVEWKFGVCMAGRAPLVSLSGLTPGPKLVDAGEISEGFDFNKPGQEDPTVGHRLKMPTVHIHGTQDPGIHLHRRLLLDYCEQGTTTLVEWEGTHRIAIKSTDVSKMVDAIISVAKQAGVALPKK